MSLRPAGGPVAMLERAATLRGWRGALLTLLAGALTAAALPPVGAWPVLFVTAPVLVMRIDRAADWRGGALAGFFWGWGYFIAGLYWIGISLLVDAQRFAWILPFADVALPAYFALFTALAGALAKWGGRRGLPLVLALAGTFHLGEWLRGHALTGFAWNLLGSAWIDVGPVARSAALIGTYGLSTATLLVAALPALALTGRSRRERRAGLAVGLVPAAVLAGWGLVHAAPDPVPRAEPRRMLRIVQAAIPIAMKLSDEGAAGAFRAHLDLSRRSFAGPAGKPDLLIWPETALPYRLDADPRLSGWLGNLAAPGGVALIGAVRSAPDAAPGGPGFRVWNSLYAIGADGTVLAAYDKHHLVPFGEYLPLRSMLSAIGLQSVAAGAIDFSEGPGPQSLSLPNLPPVSPLICYEAIFPEEAVDPAARPGLIVNVTNDAWFGRSSGPYQHLAAARLRAIEQGLPLLRAANTGISAVIDPFGRVEQSLPLGKAGVIDAAIPRALAPTPYARYGELPAALLAAAVLMTGILMRIVDRQG